MNRITTLLGALLLAAQASGDEIKSLDQAAVKNNQAAASSQNRVDALYDQHREALQEYRITEQEIEQLQVYNRQLREIVANQNAEVASLNEQIQQIEYTQRGIMPLMERMLLGLGQFVKLDLPFLPQERSERIANLQALLLSADTTVSEKFRRVMEAYQIELEYGRTIETYRDKLPSGELVDFLRVGRVAFYYVTLDGETAYVWSKADNAWQTLDGSYVRPLQKGILVARKQAAPSMLKLAVPTPDSVANKAVAKTAEAK